jgi:hypothetical protein
LREEREGRSFVSRTRYERKMGGEVWVRRMREGEG